ncbi:MAG: pyruvate kinase, partial [Patescibacteria group bacterium]
MRHSKAQIVATIGPTSEEESVLRKMFLEQVDVVRLNFSWGDIKTRAEQIKRFRHLEKELGKKIPIIVDLPGPRLQDDGGHQYNKDASSAITARDEELIKFAIDQGVDYISVSFVSSSDDIEKCRTIVEKFSGNQKIIAKIERAAALQNL